jgi:hypothetical protein
MDTSETSPQEKMEHDTNFMKLRKGKTVPVLAYILTYLLTYLLTYSMVQDIILNADCHSAYQKISCFLYGTQRFITVFTKARQWTLS